MKNRYKVMHTDVLTTAELRRIFTEETSIANLQTDEYQQCFNLLQTAMNQGAGLPFYVDNESDRRLVGYCLNYWPPIRVDKKSRNRVLRGFRRACDIIDSGCTPQKLLNSIFIHH